MRVVIVTESFPPDVNGVAHRTLQTARHLARRGHEPLVVAPATVGAVTTSRPDLPGIFEPGTPCPVVRVRSLPLPGYPHPGPGRTAEPTADRRPHRTPRRTRPSGRPRCRARAARAAGHTLARRQAGVNAVVHALSDRYDAVHLHLADRSRVGDRSLWSPDRLHPAERGHRTVAAGFHALLAARGLALGAPPGLEPRQPPPGRLDSWRRLATAGTGRLARRSTDLLPQLMCLAGAELWHRACGTGAHLDRRAEEALRSAPAALPPRGVPGTAEQAAPSAPVAVARARMEG